MSRPITVVKEKQKKPGFSLFIRIDSHFTWSCLVCLANHKAAPVCEAGYWIECSSYYKIDNLLLIYVVKAMFSSLYSSYYINVDLLHLL